MNSLLSTECIPCSRLHSRTSPYVSWLNPTAVRGNWYCWSHFDRWGTLDWEKLSQRHQSEQHSRAGMSVVACLSTKPMASSHEGSRWDAGNDRYLSHLTVVSGEWSDSFVLGSRTLFQDKPTGRRQPPRIMKKHYLPNIRCRQWIFCLRLIYSILPWENKTRVLSSK